MAERSGVQRSSLGIGMAHEKKLFLDDTYIGFTCRFRSGRAPYERSSSPVPLHPSHGIRSGRMNLPIVIRHATAKYNPTRVLTSSPTQWLVRKLALRIPSAYSNPHTMR
jgi:hypothetical protein